MAVSTRRVACCDAWAGPAVRVRVRCGWVRREKMGRVTFVCSVQLFVRRAQDSARLHYVSFLIPSAGEIRPTVIDKIQPIESIGSRLRDSNLRGCRSRRF